MIRSTLIIAAITGFSAMPALAQDFTAVQTINKIVITQEGDAAPVTTYVPIESAAPGETIFYALNYDNDTAEAAENVSLVMAVPEEVVYTENSARADNVPATVSFSSDDGASFAPRGALTVTLDGVVQPAVADDITHIRWSFSEAVAPGTLGRVGFEAVVQ